MPRGVAKISYIDPSKTGNVSNIQKVIPYSNRIEVKISTFQSVEIPFFVEQWLNDTKNSDKLKTVTWLEQTENRKKIISKTKIRSGFYFFFTIKRKYCGLKSHYIEAYLSGYQDFNRETGIYVRGICDFKITDCTWSLFKYGPDIRAEHKCFYGEKIWLRLQTEGMNGYKNVKIEVYRALKKLENTPKDPLVATFTASVINGEINTEVKTTAWYNIIDRQPEEYFYLRVRNPENKISHVVDTNGKYFTGRFLVFVNRLNVAPSVSNNTTPTKLGEPSVSSAQAESCRFEEIVITETHGKEKNIYSIFNSHTPHQIPGFKIYDAKTIVYFLKNTTSFSNEHMPELTAVLQYAIQYKSQLKITGFASSEGNLEYNNKIALQRAEAIRDFFVANGINKNQITLFYKIQKTEWKEQARKAEITFKLFNFSNTTLTYATVAPSTTPNNLTIKVNDFNTLTCFIEKNNVQTPHSRKIWTKYNLEKSAEGDSIVLPLTSKLSTYNVAPLFQYIWPGSTHCYKYTEVHIHSCAFYSDTTQPTLALHVYPDIKWTLEFKWCHKYPFAYTYGSKLHPYDVKDGKEKVIGTLIDQSWSENYGEMAQYFGLSLNAEWNRGTNLPQKIEIGQEFGLRIAKTLGIINKIKQTVQGISNSPLAKGKVMFEIKSPVIAFSAQWYLAKAKKESSKVATIVVIGVDAKPFVEAEFTINVFKLFIESVGNAVCPGAGNVISWVLDKLKKNAGIHFLIIFSGGIYANGRVNINTLYPEETSGEVKVTGKIQITVEFKAWAGAEIGYIGVDGVIKANVETSVTGGIKVGADNQGIYASPIAEFAGIKANFVAIGTIKFGIFKKTYSYEEEAIFVEPDQIPFDKSYIN